MIKTRIVIADDHPLFRGALRQALSDVNGDVTFSEAGSFDEAVEAINAGDDVADLVLLDLKMPGVQGFSGLMYMRAQYPGVPVVIVSANEDAVLIRRALDFGASGYIPKSAPVDDMRRAVEVVLNGDVWVPPELETLEDEDSESQKIALRLATLTPQQVRVLMMLGQGLLNKQIAYELTVSEATVKAHVSAILQKLDVESRTQAVIAVSRIEGDYWQEND